MLGPPRLTKMLFEAHLCGLLRPSVRALAGSESQQLAEEALALLERDAALRRRILSVGLPIVTPDARCVYRGSFVVVPPPADGADPLAAAPRGWVDLRPDEFGLWIRRAQEMVAQAERRVGQAAAGEGGGEGHGSDVDWTAIGPDDPIEPARFATWVFRFEDRGERIKR